MKYPTYLLFTINIFFSNAVLADCLDHCIEIDNECNTACPTDEGAPPCHLICHIHSCTRSCTSNDSKDKSYMEKKSLPSKTNSSNSDPFKQHKEYNQINFPKIYPNSRDDNSKIFIQEKINPIKAQPEYFPPSLRKSP